MTSTINGIMDVGNEYISVGQQKDYNIPSTGNPAIAGTPQKRTPCVAVRYFVAWLFAMLISFVPAVAFPIYQYVNGCYDLGAFFFSIFCQGQILFIAISMCITAYNDADVLHTEGFLLWWRPLVWFLILLAAVIFGVVSISEGLAASNGSTVATHSAHRTFVINIVLLAVSFVLGLVQYIVPMVKARTQRAKVQTNSKQ